MPSLSKAKKSSVEVSKIQNSEVPESKDLDADLHQRFELSTEKLALGKRDRVKKESKTPLEASRQLSIPDVDVSKSSSIRASMSKSAASSMDEFGQLNKSIGLADGERKKSLMSIAKSSNSSAVGNFSNKSS